jgi:NADPH-dependent 2,4-dienoyl-CoA reductase/sulfur reductase-like enzyme
MRILILGAGPAGLAAAEAAAAQGARVLLVDDNAAPGGQIWRGQHNGLIDQVLQSRNVERLAGTRLVAVTGPNTALLDTPDGPRNVAFDHAVLCSGARELLLPFPGWTLPGVTGAGGLQALAKGGMPLAGKRVVIGGTGPLLLASADTARQCGAEVVAILEHRSTTELARFAGHLLLAHHGKLRQALGLAASLRNIPYLHGALALRANGASRLRSLTIRHRGRERELDCDFAAIGYGLVPNLESAHQFGCRIKDGAIAVDDDQRTSVPNVWAAGEATGIGGVDKALAEGRIAGLAAAGARPSQADVLKRTKSCIFGKLLARSFAPHASLRELCQRDTLVCRCEDVRSAELAPHGDWRSAKLQTRAGMGPCQGRVCSAACEFLYGWTPPEGRQPVFPTNAATLAAAGRDATPGDKQ